MSFVIGTTEPTRGDFGHPNEDDDDGDDINSSITMHEAGGTIWRKTNNNNAQFARRPSDDDFAKMSMLSMRGGGFVVSRGAAGDAGGGGDESAKLPEIPEAPFDSPLGRNSEMMRTGSERHRAAQRSGLNRGGSAGEDDPAQQTSQGGINRTPSRIPSFRIPSKLRVLPTAHGSRRQQRDSHNDNDEFTETSTSQRDTYVDETMWNDEPSNDSASPDIVSPQTEDAAEKSVWNEELPVNPRSRASTLDRRRQQRPLYDGHDSDAANNNSSTPSAMLTAPVQHGGLIRRSVTRRTPPPSHRRLMSKRRSVSDLNIPAALQKSLIQQSRAAAAAAVVSSVPRQSIHFDESKKSLGRWLAKFLLGGKYGEPSCHRIRRLSRDAIVNMIEASDNGEMTPEISRVLLVGEPGVGRHELVRNFRSVGSSAPAAPSDDLLNDVVSRGTNFSDNSMDDIDPTQLVAFEYNDRPLVLDFAYAECEEDFIRHLIQKPPDLIIAVYSVCSTSSLDFCIAMMDRLRNNGGEIPLALVGNKCDLVVARTVSKHESRAVAKQYGITLLEVSALLGEKCPELLLGVLRQLTYNKPHNHRQNSTNAAQHDTAGQNSPKVNHTIWSRLSKTFSNK